MNIDIRMFAIFMSIASLFQVVALYMMYRLNGFQPGQGWRLLGNAKIFSLMFLVNAMILGMFMLTLLMSILEGSLLIAPLTTIAFYVCTLMISSLCTFGFAFLAYQRVGQEARAASDASDRFEQIFMSGPEAELLTRFSDGTILDCNERFITLTGYSRSEVLGQTDQSLRIWTHPGEREKLLAILKEKNFCEDFNASFSRKDGTELDGMVSAKIVNLQGEPQIVIVIRNDTGRKRSDQQIQQLMHQLQIEKDYAQNSALIDNLTLLVNRGHFDEVLSTEFYRLKRSGEPLSLIMLDVDHFKKFNDCYGHLAGDDCLRQVAAALRSLVRRKSDVVARYGGEEFAVILPETDQQGAVALAESIRKTIFDLDIHHQDSEHGGRLTVSIGVVSVQTVGLAAPEKVIEMADGALYNAKQRGRNRFEIARVPSGMQSDQVDLVRLMWRVSAESGNAIIDGQHKTLFSASNKLLSAVIENKSKEECGELIDELLAEVVEHFQTEESIFKQAGYPLAENHCRYHAELVAKAVSLADQFKRDELLIGELFSFLAYEVIARHMFMEDRKFFPYINNQPSAVEKEARLL